MVTVAEYAGDAHTVNDFRPCNINIPGTTWTFRLQQTVPASEPVGTIDTWLAANVSAAQEAAWLAHAIENGWNAKVPEAWKRQTLAANDIPAFMRAFIKVYAAREGVAVSVIVAEIKAKLNE